MYGLTQAERERRRRKLFLFFVRRREITTTRARGEKCCVLVVNVARRRRREKKRREGGGGGGGGEERARARQAYRKRWVSTDWNIHALVKLNTSERRREHIYIYVQEGRRCHGGL